MAKNSLRGSDTGKASKCFHSYKIIYTGPDANKPLTLLMNRPDVCLLARGFAIPSNQNQTDDPECDTGIRSSSGLA